MNNKHLTPVWIVYVDGQRLDIAHEGALQRIVVDDKLNDVGLATLEFDTSYLQVRDAGTFWLESEVSVHLGYKDDCQQVFVGEVTEFIQEYKEYGHQRLKVVCKNCLHRLQNAHQALSFEFKTLSEALVSRLESYGIKAQVDSFGTKKYFVESQITDYEFLMESANKYGKTVYAHGNKVYVQDEVTISNEDVVLEWGKSLVYFRGRESLKGQLSGCSFVGWDSRKGQGITGRVSLGEVPVKVGGGRSWEDNSKAAGGRWHSTIMAESLRDREEAVVLAKAYLQNLSMQYQMAECKCEGDQRILPGMRVTVKYVGESYSGEYIANHVLHEFSVYGGYTTTLYLKRNMAGGEKKRVSPIDSEMMRERLRRMEERMHGPVDREQVAVHEAEVEPALAAETTPPAENQETGEEIVINSHESKVITVLDRILKNPNFFEFSVYERKALGKGKRNEILTHNLYVIRNISIPEEMTLSYNGTETAPFSEGAWILNTDMDIDSYYSYSRGNNSYDMRLLVSSEYIDTEQTARKIKESIKSDIAYFFLDHKINLKEHENCNTALFSTLVPKKK